LFSAAGVNSIGEFEKAARRVYEKTGKPVLVFLDDVHRGYDDTGITGMGTPPYIPPCSLPPAAAAPGALSATIYDTIGRAHGYFRPSMGAPGWCGARHICRWH
jgi:hypothetical protein